MLRRLIKSLIRSPDDEAAQAEQRLQAQFRQARLALQANGLQETIDAIEPFLAARPDHPEARFMRGTALLDLERPREALLDLGRAVELAPQEPRYLYNLALAHWVLGESAQTIELCKRALAQGDFRPAHVLLSNIEMHGDNYFAVLQQLHEHLRPATYIEIGVFRGWSLELVQPDTQVLGIDPNPVLEKPVRPNHRIFSETSDDFFASHDVKAEFGGRAIDLAFIDGMHQFEFALRDFINVERLSSRDSVILIHDCYPLDAATASRERNTMFWSGDVWRLIVLLKKYRPDLAIRTIAAPPTGLGMITGLDPTSRVLADRLDELVAEGMAMDFSVLEGRKQEALNLFANDWSAIQSALDTRVRS